MCDPTHPHRPQLLSANRPDGRAALQGSCNVESTGAANMTLYRMTQFGVVDMTNKNTGDVPGDTSTDTPPLPPTHCLLLAARVRLGAERRARRLRDLAAYDCLHVPHQPQQLHVQRPVRPSPSPIRRPLIHPYVVPLAIRS